MAQNHHPPCTTVAYKTIGSREVFCDVYPPKRHLDTANPSSVVTTVPAVVYFHGGGLTVGNRKSWFPHWLYTRTVELGFAFLVPDYQLVPPSTGLDIISDIKEFFSYIKDPSTVFATTVLGGECRYRIDLDATAVAGSSAGGLCAYLAATISEPKLRAVISMYGMGGDFMTPHYLEPKNSVFVPGRELLDPKNFEEYIYPFSLETTTESELQYHPDNHPTPGLPANPRMLLGRLYLQLGIYLDYYTGEHELGLSERLRAKRREIEISYTDDDDITRPKPRPEEWGGPLIPERHRVLFPQLNVTSEWPAAFLIHGTDDYLVRIHESEHCKNLLETAGVPVMLRRIEGKGHSFDYEEGAEVEFGWLFDEVGVFLREKLGHEARVGHR